MFGQSLTNTALLELVGQKVYGHLEAKKMLINAFNRAVMRWHQEFNLRQTEDILPLRNTLLIGDSGTGKTFLVETVAELCGFTLIQLDATQIVPSGAGGELKVEKIIEKVQNAAEFESQLLKGLFSAAECQRKIVVFIDEIDKLGYSFEGSGNWNKHVQSNLLQLIEEKSELKGVTFIFAGAFSDLCSKKVEKHSIGFTSPKEKNKAEIDWSAKIVEAGMIPELVGRLAAISKLDDLTFTDYKKILTNYIIPNHLKVLQHYGYYEFKIPNKKKNKIINDAIESRQGVRFLKREVQKISNDIEFNFETHYPNWSSLK